MWIRIDGMRIRILKILWMLIRIHKILWMRIRIPIPANYSSVETTLPTLDVGNYEFNYESSLADI